MFEITVEGWFAAAHQLRLLDGSLEPLHGHNWRVRVTLAGPKLDEMGVLADFTRIQPRLAELLADMHDRFLNEFPALSGKNPSAEAVAMHVAEGMRPHVPPGVALRCVEIEEAPGCVARYLPDDI